MAPSCVKTPAVLWQVPVGVVVLFTLRGIGDYVQSYYPSWVGRQVIKGLRHDVFSHYLRLPTAFLDRQQSGHLLSRLTNNIELVAAAATSAADLADQRQPHPACPAGDAVLHELAAGDVLHHRRAGDRLADADRQPHLPALQRAHPELHGRHHEGGEGSARCASADQDIQRREPSDRALRAGQRAQSRLEHEADPRTCHQQSGGAGHRRGRAGERAVRGHAPGVLSPPAGGRVLRLPDRARC